ncbi:MAG: iron ABC transporter permease [Hyphomicrobiaceae bacterium]|nr:iron ABC transporter permease [Hyphomicrobiaceae bacterium]
MQRHAPASRRDVGAFHGREARHLLTWGCGALVLACAVLSLGIGPTGLSLGSLPRAVLGAWTGSPGPETLVLLNLRLPRVLLGVFVGAGLAVSGAVMQGLFRNPLADPGLIGVSSGAALAAVATIALGNGLAAPLMRAFGVYALPLAAFFGGLATTVVLMAVARRSGTLLTGTLLLAGVAIAALCGSLTGILAYASDDRELRDLTLWSMGSLAGASWPKVVAVLPFTLLLLALVPRLTRALNGFLLGEAEAFHLGIDVERAKRLCVLLTAAATGAAVAVAGIVGFVGIVVPHLMRLLAGPDHRFVLPGSAALGASLVLLADIFARMAVRPAELPLGLVLAILGAPVFLHLVVRRGAGGGA